VGPPGPGGLIAGVGSVSRFDDAYASCALPEFLREFGQSVTYHDPDLDPASITAVVGSEETEQLETNTGVELRHAMDVTVLTDTSSEFGGVSTPRRSSGDIPVTVTFEGQTWTVEAVAAAGPGWATLHCVRPVLARTKRPGET